jgi:hypothetical protein
MQAAIVRFPEELIATPFGRGAVGDTNRVFRVVASSQAKLAAPRFVIRTLPSIATTPAASGKPFNVATCRLVS